MKQHRYTIRDHIKKYNEDNPIIDTRYYVVEVTPSRPYSYNDGHGRVECDWTDKKEVRVSAYFKTKEYCDEFIRVNEPDDGNSLEVRSDNLRRITTERWE